MVEMLNGGTIALTKFGCPQPSGLFMVSSHHLVQLVQDVLGLSSASLARKLCRDQASGRKGGVWI
jgi:hypothetical protein